MPCRAGLGSTPQPAANGAFAVFTAAPAPPAVATIAPVSVANSQPAALTIIGVGLVGESRAFINNPAGTALGDLLVQSDTVLTAVLPPGVAPGSYSILVTSAGGTRPS